MQDVSVGVTFPITDPETGRKFIGWGSSIDTAVADALSQLNAAIATRMSVRAVVQQYIEDSCDL